MLHLFLIVSNFQWTTKITKKDPSCISFLVTFHVWLYGTHWTFCGQRWNWWHQIRGVGHLGLFKIFDVKFDRWEMVQDFKCWTPKIALSVASPTEPWMDGSALYLASHGVDAANTHGFRLWGSSSTTIRHAIMMARSPRRSGIHSGVMYGYAYKLPQNGARTHSLYQN